MATGTTVVRPAGTAWGAVLGGCATVGAWAAIGLGSCVRDHVRVGAGAVVAMGAAVVSDVPASSNIKSSTSRMPAMDRRQGRYGIGGMDFSFTACRAEGRQLV